MKKLIFGFLFAALLLGTACADGDNLLSNGGFEENSASGMPDSWYTVSYQDEGSNTRFEVTDEKAHSGQYSAKIVCPNANDARFVTFLPVEPESVYRVSGYILVEEMDDTGNGANFALENLYAASESVFDTDGEWKYIEWYGETDTGQTVIEFGVRIGGYSAESRGTAYFDDISIEKVQSVPNDVYADFWFTLQNSEDTMQEQAMAEEESQKSTGLFILLGLLFMGVAALGSQRLLADGAVKPGRNQATVAVFAFALMAAFALRLILAGNVYGYSVDIGCFSAWSTHIASVGPGEFYNTVSFCDYPPGYMLMLWPVGQILSATDLSQAGMLIVLKTIPILCDLFTAMLLFAFAKKRISVKAAAFVGLFFAFNPAVLVTGSAWGQVDSLLSLLLMITAMLAADKKWRFALPAYIAAILVKPQALLFGPIALVWLAASIVLEDKGERKRQLRQLWQGALFALAAALVIILPFQIKQTDPLWIFKLYQNTLSSYDYAVLNTANLAYLLGGNWSALRVNPETNTQIKILSAWLPVITGLLLLSFGVLKLHIQRGLKGILTSAKVLWKGLRNKETGTDASREFILAVLCVAFGLAFLLSALWPAKFLIYGTMWMVFVYTAVVLLIIVERRAEALPFYMALMLIGVYVLGLKIHERYLFAVCALLPLAYIGTRDRRLIWLCAGLSVTTFVNTAIVLDNSILFGAEMGHLNNDTSIVNTLLGIVNVLLCGYAAYIAFTGLKISAPLGDSAFKQFSDPQSHRERLLHPKDARLHLNRRDMLLMGITFAVYCVVAFANLGSTKAPQTAWVAASEEDQAVFELQEETTFKLLYYAGVSYHNFTVSVSSDGETWSEPTICRMRQGLCYRWLYAIPALEDDIYTESFARDNEENIVWFTGKYLRVNAEFAGLNLWEILLRDENGERIPITLVSDTSHNGMALENLIDEQDTLTGEPGWFNGTYFDEIYHARTAYEHLHGQSPYETSHPPLGKEIMSVGIAMFGMTPFGWRFMGTLIGALMLPAMYLFGMQLTGRRKFAAFAMLFMALSLMHFTQTRLATIGSFPTFFIILSYLCMTRYVLADPFAVSAGKPRVLTKAYLRSLVPLLLSGLFIGCAIASKWTGLYAGAGLAVLFFYAMYRQFRSGLSAYDLDAEKLTETEAARVQMVKAVLVKRMFATIAFCLLFFAAIPLVIYYLSYIPYLSPTGAVTIQRVIRTQQSMLSYHSTPGLGMDHPFYSPWWQWPLILKPIWYAADAYVADGFTANIVCVGNPAVFYIGVLAMLAVFVLLIHKYYVHRQSNRRLSKWLLYGLFVVAAIILNTQIYTILISMMTWSQAQRYLPFFIIITNLLFTVPVIILVLHNIKKRKSPQPMVHETQLQEKRNRADQPALFILAISFLAQYLPWVLVPRSMFFYHYFASLPFIILATAWMGTRIQSKKLQNGLIIGFLLAAIILFVMFYPYGSGLTMPKTYNEFLHWFPNLPV